MTPSPWLIKFLDTITEAIAPIIGFIIRGLGVSLIIYITWAKKTAIQKFFKNLFKRK